MEASHGVLWEPLYKAEAKHRNLKVKEPEDAFTIMGWKKTLYFHDDERSSSSLKGSTGKRDLVFYEVLPKGKTWKDLYLEIAFVPFEIMARIKKHSLQESIGFLLVRSPLFFLYF